MRNPHKDREDAARSIQLQFSVPVRVACLALLALLGVAAYWSMLFRFLIAVFAVWSGFAVGFIVGALYTVPSGSDDEQDHLRCGDAS